MEYENRKLKYLDRLKKTSSKGLQKCTGVLDIQDNNLSCFNECHQKYEEPKPGPYNDLLAKVECYIRANPTSHITKNRLTVKRGLDRRDHVSNVQNRNNLDVLHKSGNVQDLENVISFIEPNRKLVKYNPDTKIKFGSPEATSTIKHKQEQHESISRKKILKPTEVIKNMKYEMSEKIFRSKCSSSSTLISSKIIRSNMQGFKSTRLDPGMNKSQCISIEEKVKLNLTYSLYLEFVHTHCDEIKSINKNVYPNNDYTIHLKKQLQKVQLKHQKKQDMKNTELVDCTDLVNNDKSINYFNMSSISSGSDFVFKPVNNLFKSPDLCTSNNQSEDSFMCSTQETLFTNTDDSMNIDEVKLEPYKEYFSSPEIFFNQNKKNICQGKITDCQSTSSFLSSCDTSLEKCTQKSKDKQKSSSISSEDSFKYYKKKMF